jgi:predicted  nucleic acid-binding Zn-ribbon protein
MKTEKQPDPELAFYLSNEIRDLIHDATKDLMQKLKKEQNTIKKEIRKLNNLIAFAHDSIETVKSKQSSELSRMTSTLGYWENLISKAQDMKNSVARINNNETLIAEVDSKILVAVAFFEENKKSIRESATDFTKQISAHAKDIQAWANKITELEKQLTENTKETS